MQRKQCTLPPTRDSGVQELDDIRRVSAIDQYGLLRLALDAKMTSLTALAAEYFQVPYAAVCLVGGEICSFRGCSGMPATDIPRAGSLPEAALCTDGVFLSNEAADGMPSGACFYASAPLLAPGGVCVGGFVIMSDGQRAFSERDQASLRRWASVAEQLISTTANDQTPSPPQSFAESEAMRTIRFVIEEIPAILWTADADLRFSSAYGAGLTALGMTEAQVVGQTLSGFFSRDGRGGAHVEAHRRALAGQGLVTEARFLDRTYRCRLDPIRNARGLVTGVLGLAVDVTDRVRFEAAVKESESRYRLIARATNDVVRDWDIDRDEILWNENLETVFRYPTQLTKAASAWWEARIHPDDTQRVTADLRDALQGDGGSWNEEYRFQRGDGTYASVFDRGFITRDRKGRAIRLLGSMLDVTERKVMEAKLIQSERLASMGTLAAGVAHEINNPLTYIMANVGFVSEWLSRVDPQSPVADVALDLPELRSALEEAQEGAVRVRQIVRDLRVFARRDEERYGVIDVRRTLESSISMVWNEIRHRARLVKDLQPVPPVLGNESRLGQVFLNLLMNAAQAIREGEASSNQIRVATDTDSAGRARITVEDTGIGIAADVMGRIFDPFFTTKPVGIGTGLGLFICHGIVKAMGGELVAESEMGRGARFQAILPAAPPQAIELRVFAPAQAGPTLRRHRLLIVDDEERVAHGLERALSHDYDLVLALGGQQATEVLARDRDFDVILCDLMMPDFGGADLFALLEKRWPQLAERVVFMTGGAFTAATTEFLERVTNPRLDKPFDSERLRAIIRELVAA